jgi:hypothetical protein
MDQRIWLRRWALLIAPALLAASCGLLGALSWSAAPATQRNDARQRWEARPFANYRIAIRVEYGGNACAQELETNGELLRRVIANNCRVAWIGMTTVARLFEISELLDHPTPCYSSMQSCSCYRVRQREIEYNPQLGYPALISYRREVQPNVTNPEYWRRLLSTRRVPACGPTNYDVTISVVAFHPIS